MMQLATVVLAALETGGYVNLFKLLPVLILLFAWARMLTWADKDAIAAHLPREPLMAGLFLAGLAGFAAFFILPNFWIALGALGGVLLGTAATYLALRNKQVGLGDLKKDMGKAFERKKKVVVKEGQVALSTRGGAVMAVPDAESPDRAGYEAAQELLTDPLRRDAEKVEVRPSEGSAAVQYFVDGVGYSMPPMDLSAAAAGIGLLKKMGGLDVKDKRKPQTGRLKATLDGRRHEIEILTAGSTAGESMRVSIDPQQKFDRRLDTLGLTQDQLAMMKAFIADPRGVVLVAAPRQQGLTMMLYSILRAHDAFLSHIQTIERVPAEDLEGITQNRLGNAVPPAEESKQVEWACSQEPDIVMIDEVASPASARELTRFASDTDRNRRVYVGMRAASGFDALNAWRKLVGDDTAALNTLGLVLCGRVLRKLCQACKIGYTPDPDTLRKLNMDPQRVQTLYQARTEPMRDQKGRPVPCTFCHDLAYRGRLGVFEMLYVDDEVRSAVAANSSSQLKTAFRKQHGRYLQEMALAQVELGETSVQEVLRVLREQQAQRPAAAQR
jgi:type II secretory ATPase GspE/PulE/Tfp pilus assembly ATPase PilB-like protein